MKHNLIEKAREFATKAHEGQFRKFSSVPYIVHPERVAALLAEQGFEKEVIAAAWLHDVVEDCEVSLDEIRKEFGDEVALLVDGMTKEKGFGNTLHKLVEFIEKDRRVFWIKIADMTDNLRDSIELLETDRPVMKMLARIILFENIVKYKEERWALENLKKEAFLKLWKINL